MNQSRLTLRRKSRLAITAPKARPDRQHRLNIELAPNQPPSRLIQGINGI
jgi:hypothetical protein